MDTETPDYRHTVFLPQTDFPLRGDLPKREPALLAQWGDAYVAAARPGGKPFVLHDGPIYANGNLHIGHALNRVLKDVILRAHRMAGYDAPYVPGWDCHGLPIEWRVEEQYKKAGRDKDAVPLLQFRAECREYAQHWLEVQTAEFRRLGVLGDWAGRYATMDFASEAAIAGEIGKFLLNGSLYRGLRPVMWSPVEKTALAEAEIEYQDRTSDTIFVRFPVLAAPLSPDVVGAAIVIWTTTAWTIPGNRAIAAGEAIDYALLCVNTVADGSLARPGERLVVAEALVPQVMQAAGVTEYFVLRVLTGGDLVGAVCAHPWRGRYGGGYMHDVPVLMADYVTADAGTGLVHTAPSHGEDDFALGRAHGLEVPETVADDGTLTDRAPGFEGVHVYKAAEPVAAALIAAGALLTRGKLTHSYPHSWRSKAPLIFRATPQWFIALDGAGRIRERALTALGDVAFIPEAGRTRLTGMVAGRPDWCISRQRAWGVPIPVFVDRATGEPLRDPAVVERVRAVFADEGADAWYASPPARFLGEGRDPAQYEQVMDIVDVWFESGSTHAFVLDEHKADLYLEGSDQHRGWFQSSLLEAVGAGGAAPFRAVLTHGFVLDETGRKMSKSLGNVTAPQTVVDQYGADVLRLWTVMADSSEDLRIGKEILKQQSELYRRLRNTLRWLLGSLHGFSADEVVAYETMPDLEKWVLHRVHELDAMVRGALRTHAWTGVYPAIHAFCAADLSAFYFDVRKDSVYCDAPGAPTRRACRTVLDILQRCLTAWLAPVLVFTAEDAHAARFPDAPSVHLETFPEVPKAWHNEDAVWRLTAARTRRADVTAEVEKLRRIGTIKSSLEADVTVPARYDTFIDMEVPVDADLVRDLSIVSTLRIDPGSTEVSVRRSTFEKCARCWKLLPEVGTNAKHPALCLRCASVVG